MSGEPTAAERLEALRGGSSNAGTVSAISTTGHVVSGGIIAGGTVSAAISGAGALKCFAGRVLAPLGGAMAGAWLAEKVGADEALLSLGQQFGLRRLSGPGKRAAHIEHQIAHSNAFIGALAGLAAGLAVGVLVFVAAAAIIGTGGMAAPLVGMAVATGAGAVGGFVGTAVAGAGAKSATLCGPISTGSPNVFFESKAAARVTDTAACTRDGGPPQIVEGSETIFINNLPMARIGHKLSCSAVVQEGCDTVFGDETTGQYGPIDADLSVAEQLLLSTLEVLGARSAVRQGGLLNSSSRRLMGEPVDIVTGDYADQRCDFEYPGILPLRLERVYPGKMRVEGALGPRWICNWSQRFVVDHEKGTALLEDEGGERLVFALGDAAQILSTHLKAPHYKLTGTRETLYLYDSRKQHTLVFVPGPHGVAALKAIEDRNGNRIDFHHDAAGQLRAIRHADGTVFRVENTPQGWLRTLTVEGDDLPLVRYDYDEQGHLLRAMGAFTGEFHYRYTPEGWLSGWRDSGPTQVEIDYDTAGRVVGTRTGDGMFNDRFLYFPEQRLSRYVDATGAVRSFWYDTNGLVTVEEDPLGNRTLHQWDGLERLQRRFDEAERETRFAYDGDGRLIAETDWAGRTSTWSYDAWGALVAATTPDGGAATWKYDAHGNAVAWSQSDGTSGEASYDERGALLSERQSGSGLTTWDRDSAGRPLACHDPGGRVTRYVWDRFGRLTETTDPAGRGTAFAYERGPANPRGDISRVLKPDGGEVRFAYDSEGLLAERVRDDGQTTRFVHGAFDTLRRVVDPLDATTQFSYDAAGRLDGLTNAANQQWRFRYDAAGRLEAQSDWAGREILYRRDALGRVVAKRMADGGEQHLEWDDRDRIVRVTAGEDAISYRYDDADRLTGASTHRLVDGRDRMLADVKLRWDGQGRLAGEEQNGVAVTYRYDAAGRCVGRTSPSGETALTFDETGLLQRYESNGHQLRFDYDASGLETLREAVSLGARNAFQLRQSYDPAGQLQEQRAGSVAVFAPRSAALDRANFSRRYDWDRAGRLVGVVDSTGDSARYRYDLRDQAVAVEGTGRSETYRYDALMNLAEGLAGEHRYWRDCVVEAGGNRFRYDARGRMVERTVATEGFRPRTWRYRWDGFDRLVALEGPGGERWRYIYDAFGRRVRKERVDTPGRDGIDYVWQGRALAESWERRGGDQDREGGGTPSLSVERWHFTPDGVLPLAKEAVLVGTVEIDPAAIDSEWLPVVTDQIGTPRALFNAEGEQRWACDATLWGRARTARDLMRGRSGDEAASDGTASCALRFPGQWEDAESGLHYNLNRYYDPETGQYLSPDPIGLQGGIRTHAYVHDPIECFDPDGLAGCPKYRYNQVENPGPLAKRPGNPAANFAGGRYNGKTTTKDIILYRGGEAGKPLGQWFTRQPPSSVAQVRIDAAVKPHWIDPKTGVSSGSSPIDNVYAIKIPKGTRIYEGPVANQGGIHVGGPNINQVFVPEPWNIPGVQVVGKTPIK